VCLVCGPKILSPFCRRWKHKNVVHGIFHSWTWWWLLFFDDDDNDDASKQVWSMSIKTVWFMFYAFLRCFYSCIVSLHFLKSTGGRGNVVGIAPARICVHMCALAHETWSKSIWTDAVQLTILNLSWLWTKPLWSRPLLLRCSYSRGFSTAGSTSDSVFGISGSCCILIISIIYISSDCLPVKLFSF